MSGSILLVLGVNNQTIDEYLHSYTYSWVSTLSNELMSTPIRLCLTLMGHFMLWASRFPWAFEARALYEKLDAFTLKMSGPHELSRNIAVTFKGVPVFMAYRGNSIRALFL